MHTAVLFNDPPSQMLSKPGTNFSPKRRCPLKNCSPRLLSAVFMFSSWGQVPFHEARDFHQIFGWLFKRCWKTPKCGTQLKRFPKMGGGFHLIQVVFALCFFLTKSVLTCHMRCPLYIHIYIYICTLRSLTAGPWKMMVGRRSFPFGKVLGTCQGRAVKLQVGSYFKCS